MTPELRRQWGANIQHGRRAVGLKRQEDLAFILQIRQSTVSKWERGIQSPSDDMKARLAQVLHQHVRDLFPLVARAA